MGDNNHLHMQMEKGGKLVCYFISPSNCIKAWEHEGRGVADMMAFREGWIDNPRSIYGGCNERQEDFDHSKCANVTLAEFKDGGLVIHPGEMDNGARRYFGGVWRWSDTHPKKGQDNQ